MKTSKKTLFLFTALFLSVIGTVGAYIFTVGGQQEARTVFSSVEEKNQETSISPIVKNAYTNSPVENAIVYVYGTENYKRTYSDGTTDPISVPFERDDRFDEILKKDWGEVTLFVYADGYVPYVLFNCAVYENQERSGPEILLVPLAYTSSNSPIVTTEAPERAWVNDLFSKLQEFVTQTDS